MTARRRVSEAVDALPIRFDAHGLITQATSLLREHADDPTSPGVSHAQLRFYLQQRLVDEPRTEGSRQIFGRRQLLQLCAVQILRGVDLELDRIGGIVQGMGDEQLKLLCDHPDEAAKKAAVMSNWLGMLEKGRYSRADRGETAMMHQPEIERVVAQAPPADVASVLRHAKPVAPDLDSLGLPDAAPADLGTLAALEHATAATPGIPDGLPDSLPDNLPGGPTARSERPTMAHGDAMRLMAALGVAAAGREPSQGSGDDTVYIRDAEAAPPVEVRQTAQHAPPPAPPPPPQRRTSAPRPAPAEPAKPRPAAARQPQPSQLATFALAKAYRRMPVGRGVELHVELAGPRRDAEEIEAILERIRQVLLAD